MGIVRSKKKRKEEGGTETVDICPNCHADYHLIANAPHFTLSQRLLSISQGVLEA